MELQGLNPLKLLTPLHERKTASKAEILFLSASLLAQAMEDTNNGQFNQALYKSRLKEANRLIDDCNTLTLYNEDIKSICKSFKINNPLL